MIVDKSRGMPFRECGARSGSKLQGLTQTRALPSRTRVLAAGGVDYLSRELIQTSCTAGKVLQDMELVWEDDLTSYVTDENENGGTATTPSGTISERVHEESQKTSRVS